jgi:hypothetical protein
MSQSDGSGERGDAARYEQAATETLEMLDWCIGYFVGIHKDQIASRLASNRRHIKEDLMHEPEEPLPTGDSNDKANSGNSRPTNNGNGDSGRSKRYKQAATDALEMLDWSIGFLVGSRKESIAAQLARNRKHIREDLMREPAEPVPTSEE